MRTREPCADLVVHSGWSIPSIWSSLNISILPRATSDLSKVTCRFSTSMAERSSVVELYKVPTDLFETIAAGTRMIWLAAAVAGAFSVPLCSGSSGGPSASSKFREIA